MEVLLKVINGQRYGILARFYWSDLRLPWKNFLSIASSELSFTALITSSGKKVEVKTARIFLNSQTDQTGLNESYISLPHIRGQSPTWTRICPQSNSSTSSWCLQRWLTSTHKPLRPRQCWWPPRSGIWEWLQSPIIFDHNQTLEGKQQSLDIFFRRRTYNIFIHELSEVEEATLLCQRVWVVSILVHHAVGLQSSRTLQEDGGQLLQTVPCSEMEQRGKFLFALIWSQNNASGLNAVSLNPSGRKSEVYTQASMLCSSICLIPKSWKLDSGILDFSDSVSISSRDSVTFDVKLKAWQEDRKFQLWKWAKRLCNPAAPLYSNN